MIDGNDYRLTKAPEAVKRLAYIIVLNDLHTCNFLAECLPWQPISYQAGVLFYLDPRSTVRLAAGLSRFSSVSRKLTACVSLH